MNNVHVALQGKGGVGKSLICRFLGEYFDGSICIDADPENRTLFACESLDVREFNLLDDRRSIDQLQIDRLMAEILEEPGDVVLDIGASSYVEIAAYWRENDLSATLHGAGKSLWTHIVVVGGPSQGASLRGVTERVSAKDPHANICVWENHYFGKVSSAAVDLLKQAGYPRIVLQQRGILFVHAIENMIDHGQTFEDAIAEQPELPRKRLKIMKQDIWKQLDLIFDEPVELAS